MAQLVEAIDRPLQVASSKILKGIFAVCDEFNQNGRRYPEDIYDPAYEELLPKIKERRLLGELDHPMDRDEVFLSNVSHVITDCYTSVNKLGHKVYKGTVELLDTPAGKIAQALVKAGIPIGISSRGVGNTKQVSGGVDVTQLKLITYDLVAEPSFKTAILSEDSKLELSESLNAIESKIPLNESKEYDSIRNSINNIRESLKLNDDEPGVHIDQHQIQSMEIDALKSLLESKTKIIAEDTRKLKEQRERKLQDAQRITELEADLSSVKTRYTALRDNHSKLQESYNNLESTYKTQITAMKDSYESEILELRKRLAVEQRGMSYSQVKDLLEGASTESDITSRLDSISNMSTKSNSLTESALKTVQDSLMKDPKSRSPLSRVVSRV